MDTLTRPGPLADQNDQFRRHGPAPGPASGGLPLLGRVAQTQGITALRASLRMEVLRRVRRFEDFPQGDDPHGEHDFGGFDIEEDGRAVTVHWKLDCHDRDFEYGSPASCDPLVTARVLTIMLACEY